MDVAKFDWSYLKEVKKKNKFVGIVIRDNNGYSIFGDADKPKLPCFIPAYHALISEFVGMSEVITDSHYILATNFVRHTTGYTHIVQFPEYAKLFAETYELVTAKKKKLKAATRLIDRGEGLMKLISDMNQYRNRATIFVIGSPRLLKSLGIILDSIMVTTINETPDGVVIDKMENIRIFNDMGMRLSDTKNFAAVEITPVKADLREEAVSENGFKMITKKERITINTSYPWYKIETYKYS